MKIETGLFEQERTQLTSLCYRMLGERAGAEDAVQDTWLRWSLADKTKIHNPRAWLRRTATNIAIDTLRSARARRETYVGPWLPEPLVGSDIATGEDHFVLAQECELALLWAMEVLGEHERAAFILREAFDIDYNEISECLGSTPAACRQMVSRAHRKLQNSGPRFNVPPDIKEDLLFRFFKAVEAENAAEILKLLSPDTVTVSDGGGKVSAALRPLFGPQDALKLLTRAIQKAKQNNELTVELITANDSPALVIKGLSGEIENLVTISPDDQGRVGWIYIMRNPDKLPRLNLSSVNL
ncbi:RNA polymerase sigma factor SigJ [Pseudovibrio japonicus]|uniref:RNA polymerase sigma factor SigJ n=1 Tax=Pseudovibrio japonicus TaxID=366534 RepID=A0ABQ3EK88_9HYPH|nr:RNA polymerase sigma factor SigJ [Pseudovibrio japonicus]GHB44138.1 RNA polymerase sigma factor SigJ [Pseudovibrio japonicus]